MSVFEWPTEAIEPWWMPTWLQFADEYTSRTSRPAASEEELRRELIFCLLGGHAVPYELALSASDVVLALDPFGCHWRGEALQTRLEEELSKPQFEPERRDGTLRRYRFPSRKAQLIARAVEWTHANEPLVERLSEFPDDASRREWLCNCPGVGEKTASWLLRNSGWGNDLAILDVHVLRAMSDAGLVDNPRLPADYALVERTYLDWAETLDACPAALDLFLWDVERMKQQSRGRTELLT
jgi:thermostable 8-oxoguanine DNA glycosylase